MRPRRPRAPPALPHSDAVVALLGRPTTLVGAFLGLDVSSAAVGMGVIGRDGALLHSSSHAPLPGDSPFSFAERSISLAAGLVATHGVTSVGVEDFMRAYAAGSFATRNLFVLARGVSIVSYGVWAGCAWITGCRTGCAPTLA